MNSTLNRVLSGIAAAGVVILIYKFLGSSGLKALCLVGTLLSARETARLVFPQNSKEIILPIFYIAVIATFFISSDFPTYSSNAVSLSIISFSFICMGLLTKTWPLDKVLEVISRFVLAIFYAALLPSFLWRILNLNHGNEWFISLLVFVFFGDIGAYAIGSLFGKQKILPAISPKKSVQGALGGLLFSTAAVVPVGILLPEVPVLSLVILAILSGIMGQIGDFFESLLKRVSDRKDSGTLMPGHGGLLDRVDGILFAAPIFFLAASYIEKLIF